MKTLYQNLEITAKLKNEGAFFPNTKGTNRHNEYLVKVKNTDTNKSITFNFYDSTNNHTKGIKTLDDSGLLDAFYCFVQDAVSGELSQDDFCNEFGYDYFDGRKIHRLCQKQKEKFEKIIFDDVYDFVNELQEFTEN